jgi:hypothetical protein
MRRRTFWVASTLAALAAAAALAPTAAADQPVTTETHFDRTRTISGLCAFPLQLHTFGTIRQTVYSSGKIVKHAVDFHITYTNPTNGKSASTVLAGPVIIEPNGDGTVTVTINGNDGHITAPGQGTVFADVGKFVYLADASDPDTPLTVLKSTGRQDASQFPATCDAIT